MNECVICGSKRFVESHHLDYKKNIIIKICRTCHRKIHIGKGFEFLKPIDKPKNGVIKISKKLKEKLEELGKKGDTYEDIIWRLIKKWNATFAKQKWRMFAQTVVHIE